MPSNQEKTNQRARQQIDRIITEILPKTPEGLSINAITRQILLSYAVNPNTVKKFIEDYYIKEGIITNENGNTQNKMTEKKTVEERIIDTLMDELKETTHNTRTFRLDIETEKKMLKIIIKNQDRYYNESHFIRCAINRLIRLEEEMKRK